MYIYTYCIYTYTVYIYISLYIVCIDIYIYMYLYIYTNTQIHFGHHDNLYQIVLISSSRSIECDVTAGLTVTELRIYSFCSNRCQSCHFTQTERVQQSTTHI